MRERERGLVEDRSIHEKNMHRLSEQNIWKEDELILEDQKL